MRTIPTFLSVDGHQVTLAFSPETDPALLQTVKQILLSSYINDGIAKSNSRTIADMKNRRYNTEGGKTNAP